MTPTNHCGFLNGNPESSFPGTRKLDPSIAIAPAKWWTLSLQGEESERGMIATATAFGAHGSFPRISYPFLLLLFWGSLFFFAGVLNPAMVPAS